MEDITKIIISNCFCLCAIYGISSNI